MQGENINLLASLFKNFWAFLTVLVLVFASGLSIYYIVERALRFQQARIDVEQFLAKLKKLLTKGGKFDKTKVGQAVELCTNTKGPVAVVIKAGLIRYNMPRYEIEDNMQRAAMGELAKLEKNLIVIGTIGNVAPFIGLLGTVIGVTESFTTLASIGGGGLTAVGAGIAQALIATIVGLFVAIPAVIGYNFLIRGISKFENEIALAAAELINIIMIKNIDIREVMEDAEA